MLRWIKNKTGQIAVLLALSFGLLTLLVAMVVNIGFLVAAKINLQNSVDMAAYAGAAQQARYLTEIGKWNYEMRRNYKAMVFDYLLTYNAELKRADNPAENEFRMYINNMDQNGNPKETYPLFCASLQGGSGNPESSSVRKIICQKVKQHTFQDALQAANNAIDNLIQTSGIICGLPNSNTACQNMAGTIAQQIQSTTTLQDNADADKETFVNYVNGDPKNYNLRLLMWMLHDYRHLQSRIRGVHFGDISIGSNANNNLTGRWDFFKDKNKLSFFQNAPMSVAAKVINGFTSSEDTTTKLEANKANLLENNGELIKNPVNEAALSTFKNNLMTVIEKDAKLFHLTPQNFNTNSASDMSGGCSGQCTEFSGPYLKIKEHDINFMGYYIVVDVTGDKIGTARPADEDKFKAIGSFPVGVAKDERLLTYYTVVGTAKTYQIPFNVFFGNQESSNKEVIMVAVASARPFGSRIGPFINDQCSDLYDGTNKINCIKNGLDPLYPFKGEKPNFPNFSILEKNNDVRKLGVKLSVSNQESQKATKTFPGHTTTDAPFTEFYGVGRGIKARARDFRYKKNNSNDYSMDDGFGSSGSWNPPASDPAFFDHDQTCIHPVGNRNSVWAWWGNIEYEQSSAKNVPQNKRANYEGYLELAAQENNALYKFAQLPKRKTSGLIGQDPYTIYVFKYPGINSTSPHDWDIDGLTKRGDYGSWMERAFANTMAVSPFELKRYILPSRNDDSPQLNYLNAGNKDGFIYHGAPNREVVSGQGNKKFEQDVVSGAESVDTLRSQGGIGESYTSWRIGTRGYRVKLIKVKDLVADNCTSKYQNCLNSTYTLDDTGGESFTIDLSKIDY